MPFFKLPPIFSVFFTSVSFLLILPFLNKIKTIRLQIFPSKDAINQKESLRIKIKKNYHNKSIIKCENMNSALGYGESPTPLKSPYNNV
jgi:hypothetical protein